MIAVFESGAVPLYLAVKTGKFMPSDFRGESTSPIGCCGKWAGLGPMAGQNHHFSLHAPAKTSYAIDQCEMETNRLYAVLDKRAADRQFIVGGYSIADMATYPWIVP
jgi:GST-like protein